MSEYILDLAEDSPIEHYAIDTGAESIVRCRDCVWAKPDQSDHEFRELRCNMWIADVSADGFCSRGKREQ